MEFRLHAPISNAIYLQLEQQPGTLNSHVKREVQIIEFDALSGCQTCEQRLGNGVQVGSECTDVEQPMDPGLRSCFIGTSN